MSFLKKYTRQVPTYNNMAPNEQNAIGHTKKILNLLSFILFYELIRLTVSSKHRFEGNGQQTDFVR